MATKFKKINFWNRNRSCRVVDTLWSNNRNYLGLAESNQRKQSAEPKVQPPTDYRREVK